MKKKNLLRLGAFVLVASALAGCGGVNPPGESYIDENGKKIYTYNYNMYIQGDTTYPETHDNAYDKMLYDDFGIVFNYERIARTDWETKTNTYFATNDAPDITTGGKEINYKGWANQQMLVPVADSYEDLCEKMPNYVKLFGDNMEDVYNLASSSDGKLYYLPSLRQEKAQMCWVYRKDIFDELGLEFPKTTDEFLEVCRVLKEKYPDKIIISSNGQKTSSLTGFFQAFGMPELILSKNSYYDPKDEEFVPYAMASDTAREMYIFLRKLNELNYLDKEILSLESDRFSSRCATDNAMITYNYVYNAESFTNKTNVNGKEGAEWSPTDIMITADPEKGTVFKKDPLYSDYGPAFSMSCISEEGKLDAVLKYFDWAATPEGQVYHTYGVEGESFHYEDASTVQDDPGYEDDWCVYKDGRFVVPVVNEGWYDMANNSSGTKIADALGIPSVFGKQPKKFWEDRGSKIEGLYQSFMSKIETDNYYYIEDIPMRYTSEEESQYTDLSTALATKRDEYMARFIFGDMDPANDDDWNQYISDMNRVGLQRFIDLQTRVFERTQANLDD